MPLTALRDLLEPLFDVLGSPARPSDDGSKRTRLDGLVDDVVWRLSGFAGYEAYKLLDLV
jgi:hypothetical protein